MYTISLHNLIFDAILGIYPEEQLVPGTFKVDVDITLASQERLDELQQTVDYVNVYQLIRKLFESPQALLESLSYDIAHMIKQSFPLVDAVRVTIVKTHLPVVGMRGAVSVSYITSWS